MINYKNPYMEWCTVQIRILDNAESRYKNVGSIQNEAMEKNNENKMDGAQNKRSVGIG